MERYQRLKHARERRFKTAADAARYLGIPYGTLTGHEAGSRGIKDAQLEIYASAYRVTLPWLKYEMGPKLSGQADPADDDRQEWMTLFEQTPVSERKDVFAATRLLVRGAAGSDPVGAPVSTEPAPLDDLRKKGAEIIPLWPKGGPLAR